MPGNEMINYSGEIAGFGFQIEDTLRHKNVDDAVGVAQASVERWFSMTELADDGETVTAEMAHFTIGFEAATEEGLDAAMQTSHDVPQNTVLNGALTFAEAKAATDESEAMAGLRDRLNNRIASIVYGPSVTTGAAVAAIFSGFEAAHSTEKPMWGAITVAATGATAIFGTLTHMINKDNKESILNDASTTLRPVFRRTHMVKLARHKFTQEEAVSEEVVDATSNN
jgi:hypothetical protein